MPTVYVPLRWGFYARVTTRSDGIQVELYHPATLGTRIWYTKLSYQGGEQVYDTPDYKIVFGVSGRSVYVRGEYKRTRPRARFGPTTILRW